MVIAVVGAAVYPSGVELRLTVRSRLVDQRTPHGLLGGYDPHPARYRQRDTPGTSENKSYQQ